MQSTNCSKYFVDKLQCLHEISGSTYGTSSPACVCLLFQIFTPPPDESMDYADADYKDLYEFGPLSYNRGAAKNKKYD